MRDLPLLHRLSEQGILLHAESALTKSCQPLRGALFSMVSRGDYVTYVWRSESNDAEGFIQIHLDEDEIHAHLVCIGSSVGEEDNSSTSVIHEDAWLGLIDGAVAAIGRRGAHSLVAEVDETGPELPVLRHAGFAVYTRQDIWVLEDGPEQKEGLKLHLCGPEDDWDIDWLYANTVPPLIQLVEPAPPDKGKIWVLREEGELAAFVHVYDGPLATWIQFFIHPNAFTQIAEIVSAAVRVAAPQASHPLYCCVRRYQSWLQTALQQSGFHLCRSQAVMVRHIAHPVQRPAMDLRQVLAANQAPASSLLQPYKAVEKEPASLVRERG